MKNVGRITIIIQARLGSSRLRGKVLAKIQGKPMIWHVITRAKLVKNVDQIILATSNKHKDKTLLKIAKHNDIESFAGNEKDVLDRFYQAGLRFNADPIIRITGDCPLIDPLVIDEMLRIYLNNDFDLVTNTIKPTFPDGLDVSIFSFRVLHEAWKKATLQSEREHVVPYIIKNKKKFKIFNYTCFTDLSNLRWTVDESADLKFVRKIYFKMKPKKIFFMKTILKLIQNNPSLTKINSGIIRDEGYLKSLKHDKKLSNMFID